jgi:hypothetical protein
VLHHGGNSPELAHALRALDINDMDQLKTLTCRFEILIAYQCIDLPDNITNRLIFKTLPILLADAGLIE